MSKEIVNAAFARSPGASRARHRVVDPVSAEPYSYVSIATLNYSGPNSYCTVTSSLNFVSNLYLIENGSSIVVLLAVWSWTHDL
jgi:hypothetical protein